MYVSAVFLAGACGGSTGSLGPSTSGPAEPDGGADARRIVALPCDVDAILQKNCRTCHSAPPQYGAPMPLATRDDLVARAPSDPSKHVYELVARQVADERSPMPPPPNRRLSEDERKVLEAWAAAGAPRGPDSCGSTGPGAGSTVACRPDLTLAPSEPWTMPAESGDEYVCWGIDLTRPTPTHVTAFVPRIDNARIVHHVVLYEAGSSYDPKPKRCSAGSSISWRMVLGWAPGAKGLELPPDAGFPIATTGATHYVVQMHYSNPQKLVGAKDASAIELCTSPPRKYEADVLAFGTQDIEIPPNPPGGTFERECSITVPAQFAGLHFFAAMPHMHKLGVKIATALTPSSGGASTDLGTMLDYDFNAQAWLPIDATTASGDVITTTCGWKNPTGREVKFGESSDEEMCYSFTMYYPRIKSPAWSWALPAGPPPLGATCRTK